MDSRWLFSLVNPCLEFILVVPLVVNLVTIAGILYERSLAKSIEVDPSFLLLVALYIFLAVLSLLLLVRTYMLAEGKLRDSRENYEAIRLFIHNL
jgi:hypothetical protein